MKRIILRYSFIIDPTILLLLVASLAFAVNGEESSRIKALIDMRIIDAKNEEPIEKGTIIIRDNIITEIGKRTKVDIPKGTKIINLEGKTVMPGLIDVHCHVTFFHGDPRVYTLNEPDALVALRATQNFKTLLETGVTTIRDTGGLREVPNVLKKALRLKLISGPRYYHPGRIITNTGGHGWKVSELVDGKLEIIRAIRNRFPEKAYKCDFIKLTWNLPSGYTHEEIKAAIETTHKYGKKIAIHAYQKETVRACIKYGADTIEHGWEVDSGIISLAIKNKTIIVPTVYWVWRPLFDKNFEDIMGKFYGKDYIKMYLAKKKIHWKIIMDHLKPYVAAGGMIAMGTDSGGFPVDFNNAPDELLTYKELGLTPFQIIQAGTINGARAIGIENKTGTLEKGKWADMIVLDGNPLEDLKALKRVKMVILNGKVMIDKR